MVIGKKYPREGCPAEGVGLDFDSARAGRWRALPLGVTGNTPDSGSGESWFDPRRGNSR